MQQPDQYLLKHANHMVAVIFNVSVGDHLKTAVHDRSAEEVIPHEMHVV